MIVVIPALTPVSTNVRFMDIISELENDLAVAIFVERDTRSNLDSECAIRLIDSIDRALNHLADTRARSYYVSKNTLSLPAASN